MPLTDRKSACTCLGSGYATPTGHHPGCPEHVRQMRRERYRTTDGECSVGGAVTTGVPLRAHLAWVAEKARTMEELIPRRSCTCQGVGPLAGHFPGCTTYDRLIRGETVAMMGDVYVGTGCLSFPAVDPYRITDTSGE